MKHPEYVRRTWPIFQIPLLGLAISLSLFIGVRMISPHPGERCVQLGQITEEWELGMPSRMLICQATLNGDLHYGRAIAPEKKVADTR